MVLPDKVHEKTGQEDCKEVSKNDEEVPKKEEKPKNLQSHVTENPVITLIAKTEEGEDVKKLDEGKEA